jgi:hypothetical protein
MCVIGWDHQLPSLLPRNGAAMMDGHNTPARALTQMIKLQKATESDTPGYPFRIRVGDTETTRDPPAGEGAISARGASGILDRRTFRSAPAGDQGLGSWFS